MIATIIIGLIWLCVVYECVCRYYVPKRNDLIPTYPGKLPIVGHSFLLMKVHVLFQTLKSFGEYAVKTGDVTAVFVGPVPFYVVTEPEDVTTVLNKCLEKMFFYRFGEAVFGKMLISADVPVWKRNRKILDLCFKQNVLDEYLHLFIDQSHRFVESLAEHVGKGEVNIVPNITRSTLETSCRTTLGARLDGKALVNDNYIEAIDDSAKILTARVYKPWLMLDCLFERTSYHKKLLEKVEIIGKLTTEMLSLRKKEYLDRLKYKTEFNYEDYKFKSILDILLENTVTETSSMYTDLELRNLIDNMLIGGFDTSIYEMLYSIICIGSYPEVQEKIYQEIIQVVGEDGELTREKMSKLVYLDASIKESIRLYPIGPVVARHASHDTKLRNVTIPAGSNVVVHVWSVNRHPKYWGPDAEEFKPERWLNRDTFPEHPAAYASFSPGRRGCIGKQYGLMFLTATLVPLIKKYKLISDHKNMKVTCEILLKPVSGYFVKLEERQSNKNI